jgi:hypothetical protein
MSRTAAILSSRMLRFHSDTGLLAPGRGWSPIETHECRAHSPCAGKSCTLGNQSDRKIGIVEKAFARWIRSD